MISHKSSSISFHHPKVTFSGGKMVRSQMKNPAVSGGVQQKCLTSNSGVLDFDLHFNTGRQVDALETVNGRLLGINDVDQTLVDAHLEVLA